MNPLPRLSLAVCALAALALPGSALAGGTPAGHVLTLTVVGSPPAAVSVDSITVEAGSLTFGLWGYRNATKTFIAMGEDFRGWRGACTGVTETCTVTLTRDVVLNAYFGQDPPAEDQPVVVPPTPGGSAGAGAGSGSAGGATAPGGPAATPVRPGTPRLRRTVTVVRGAVARTTGAVPRGARSVSQVAVLRTSSGVLARGRCTVNRRQATYRCSAALVRGTWLVTTQALSGRTVVAQSTATVRIR
jgi:hypothetical protein